MQRIVFSILLLIHGLLHAGGWILNDPYPASEASDKIYYTSFSIQPKTLDPAKSYDSNEYQFIAQIYEPILQYDYLVRPYQLAPLTAVKMPQVRYYDKAGHELVHFQPGEVDHSVYSIQIKPGILYQPHPAFAKDESDHYLYYPLSLNFLDKHNITQLNDFVHTGTRELTVDDYMYQIKRMANPAVNSSIYGLMSEYIVGFNDYAKTIPSSHDGFIDLRQYPMSGLKKIDDYTFEITIHGQYPQFVFWLAMPFFSPIPWEVDRLYATSAMTAKNLGFGWFPVGTGPFMLFENNPNNRMVLVKNPNYREEFFPMMGSVSDEKNESHKRHQQDQCL